MIGFGTEDTKELLIFRVQLPPMDKQTNNRPETLRTNITQKIKKNTRSKADSQKKELITIVEDA